MSIEVSTIELIEAASTMSFHSGLSIIVGCVIVGVSLMIAAAIRGGK